MSNGLTWREPYAQVGTIGTFQGVDTRRGTIDENVAAVIKTSLHTPTLAILPLKNAEVGQKLLNTIRRGEMVVVEYTRRDGLQLVKAYGDAVPEITVTVTGDPETQPNG